VNKRLKIASIVLSLLIVSLSCTIGKDQGAVETSVAQTVDAEGQTEEPTELAQPPTITPEPSITAGPGQPTVTPKPCNKAEMVSETIPDDTEFNPNDNFVKSWRMRNIGTCTWSTSYKLVFYGGEQMSGPASKNLTTNVAPGEAVDVLIDLKAPGSDGTYKGIWKMQSDDGQNYAQFWVQIKVKAAAPTSHTVTLNYIAAESGMVWSDGSIYSPRNVGDTDFDTGSQAFISFDISGIPAGATITEVKVDFTDYDKLGDPFGSLKCLRSYQHDYGSLDAGDFFVGVPLGALTKWCNEGELSVIAADTDVKNSMQSKLGSSRFQIRLQFKDILTDSDGIADMVRFGDVKLIVTYTSP